MNDSTQPLRIYVVGLGANLGDRRGFLHAAVEKLAKQQRVRLLAQSQLRETAPVGGPPQGAYLNGAILLEASLEPEDLLRELLDIEHAAGRERRERWGPRVLDLDLLFSPGLLLETAALTLPHPRLRERRFALEPLVEVAPWAVDPWTGERYATLLERLPRTPPGLGLDTVPQGW
ncbi:MAG: 2-amino-4-hydroxy-6-hydroxymethyldihydropteridine diphosphokinase [Myxococcales bacterium]|nr:2-amino-4-hydroxy-6-hydroxymethyldihydropteridine diphosphokinase [Polyangiaceae bacterium]MDW8249610.1 2-amino-4-hydroxy-6-hydroxymethyldihydropteridine diphosphokinase [Myxococcales bacterium]